MLNVIMGDINTDNTVLIFYVKQSPISFNADMTSILWNMQWITVETVNKHV